MKIGDTIIFDKQKRTEADHWPHISEGEHPVKLIANPEPDVWVFFQDIWNGMEDTNKNCYTVYKDTEDEYEESYVITGTATSDMFEEINK